MKHKNTGLVLAAASLMVPVFAIAGCGGSNGGIFNPTATPIPTTTPGTTTTPSATETLVPTATTTPTTSPQNVARFAGNYTGAYVAITSKTGTDVSGSFTSTTSSSGQITANITQDDGLTSTANGTVNSSGALSLTASGTVQVPTQNAALRTTRADASFGTRQIVIPTSGATPTPAPTQGTISVSYTTRLTGTDTIVGSGSLLAGSLLTTQSNGNNPRGRFVGVRNTTVASPYLGFYSGTLNATFNSTGEQYGGNLSLSISRNGLVRGVYDPDADNAPQRPLIGTVDSSGNVSMLFLGEEKNPVGSNTFTLTVTTLTAKVSPSGSTQISGTVKRAGTSAVNSTGTFSLTRSGSG